MLRNLRKLREEAGISQQALALTIGVSQQSINKYENHNIEPDIGILIRLADYFDTSVDFLIGRTDIRRKIENTEAYDLNEAESVLIDRFRDLLPNQKSAVLAVVASYLE